MITCQTCRTQTAKQPADWTAEDFLRQDVHGKRYALSLYLCGRCTRFVTTTFGDPRAWLARQLPPDLIAVSFKSPLKSSRPRVTR